MLEVSNRSKDADPTVGQYSNSTFGKDFLDGNLNIPKPKKVSPNTTPLPFVVVGDEAFGMGLHLMGPFPGRNLTRTERILLNIG